jgi:hypothetical protein
VAVDITVLMTEGERSSEFAKNDGDLKCKEQASQDTQCDQPFDQNSGRG